jgi:hypothetical protein
VTHVRAVAVDPNGEYVSMDDGYQTALPAGALSYGDELLDQHARMAQRESVLILPHAWRDPAARERLRLAGWAHTQPREGEELDNGWGAWTTYTKGVQVVHVGILKIMEPAKTPLFPLDATPHVISRRLADFHRLVGVPYRKTPGVVGTAMIRDRYEQQADDRPHSQPRWFLATWPEGVRGAGDIIWSRPREGRELEAGWIHGYDIHGAYLAAAGMADLAWGDLSRVVLPRFDPSQAGFWLLEGHSTHAPKWPGDPNGIRTPPLIHRARYREDGSVWLSTPMVRFLVDLGARPVIREALVAAPVPRGPATRRLLRVWSEHIRDARRNAFQFPNDGDRHAFKKTLKRVPNESIGLLSPTTRRGRLYRPDWTWTVRDVNRVNLLRKIRDIHHRTGRWPVRVRTDAVYYALDLEDPGVAATAQLDIALAASWSPGRWHTISTDVAHEWTDPIRAEVPA